MNGLLANQPYTSLQTTGNLNFFLFKMIYGIFLHEF